MGTFTFKHAIYYLCMSRMNNRYLSIICVQIFNALKNQRNPLKSKFFCWEGLRKGLKSVRSLLKPSAFFINKNKNFKSHTDNRQVPNNIQCAWAIAYNTILYETHQIIQFQKKVFKWNTNLWNASYFSLRISVSSGNYVGWLHFQDSI